MSLFLRVARGIRYDCTANLNYVCRPGEGDKEKSGGCSIDIFIDHESPRTCVVRIHIT
jgi:hypothetical protein